MDNNSRFINPDSSFWKNKKVLLTGHTGFKGSWLSLWLLNLGAEVVGLSLPADFSPSLFHQLQLEPEMKNYFVDIRDFDVVQNLVRRIQPDIIFHLAAQPLVRLSYKEPRDTWMTNVIGTVNILESLRYLDQLCAVVMITTDKVYRNNEWLYGYRESDPLGGHDPYSSSKAAAEIAIASWRASFCGSSIHQSSNVHLASARAGNVIGGGDWAQDRIVPDVMRALSEEKPVEVRNPHATRPWQHVLEPLSGYLCLAEALATSPNFETAFNFGPHLEANRPVKELVQEILKYWPGRWQDESEPNAPHEASLLNLVIDRAHHELRWSPRWNFATTVERTVNWYQRVLVGDASPLECCQNDLTAYLTHSTL